MCQASEAVWGWLRVAEEIKNPVIAGAFEDLGWNRSIVS
ncbi:hypothetical protein SynPROS71_01283 [Synechococcus sp. PROS-7-1]|nr:hypothetical protein SynPROS71_01283 [Synechococcus sp. PROS-7-1]